MKINPLLKTDGYKTGHVAMYPPGTTKVYSNFTPRKSRTGCNKVVVFGIQAFLREIERDFEENFFSRPVDEVVAEYERVVGAYCPLPSYDHIAELHKLGYLPLHVRALPEGTLCPVGVPILTVTNTIDSAFWLPNWMETIMSASLWHPITSATTAMRYRGLLDHYAQITSDTMEMVQWQAHDFSFRGMPGIEAAAASGAGHLLSFTGTDTVPAILWAEKYYDATGLIGGSVPATEHSIMCAGGMDDEIGTFSRLLDTYPTGILSVVSDTWNLWDVLTKIMPALKKKIEARQGTLVIRPDSGDPETILCGDTRAEPGSPEALGVIQLLEREFGSSVNSKGYKVLNPCVGAIYGDSITFERASSILARLERMGFASTSVVFGVGSYTYQYVTRDTYSFAMKATYCVVNGEGRAVFKDPITDDGGKKSAKGLLCVKRNSISRQLTLKDDCTWEEEEQTALRTVFWNGMLTQTETFDEIRARLRSEMRGA